MTKLFDDFMEAITETNRPSTESEPCEWCEGKQGKFFDVNWYDYAEHKRGEVRYCPNCGKELVR